MSLNVQKPRTPKGVDVREIFPLNKDCQAKPEDLVKF